MVIASYLSVAFVVGAVGAWHLRRDAQNQAARLMFSMAMWMAVVVAPIQILAGDQHGLNTLASSTGEDRRARGRLGNAGRHAADPVRHARHGERANRLGGGDSASRRTDPDAHLGRRDQGPEGVSAAGPAQFAGRVLGVPHHGGARSVDGGHRRVGCMAATARAALRVELAASRRAGDGAIRLHCIAVRLDRHRGGTTAVHRLWPAAHRRQRVAGRTARRRSVAGRLRRRVCDRVRRGLRLPAPPGAPAADGGRDGTADRRADPQRRHHAGRRAAGSSRDADGDMGRSDRLCRAGLRAARRLRSRRRHPVRGRAARRRSRRDAELDRTGVGRQRDLAGVRRRRAVRDVSARLCGDPAGAVSGDHRHAAGAGVPRRRLRVPLPRRERARARVVGSGVLRRLDAGGFLPGPGARWTAPGYPRAGPRLCRRLVGLADRIHRGVRDRRGGRVCVARARAG